MPLSVSLITPYGIVAERDDAEFIFAGATTGDLGILPGHAPLLSALAIGEVQIQSPKGVARFAIGGGVMDVSADRVAIMAESAEKADEIDLQRARQARQRAEDRLRQEPDDLDVARAEAALSRALNRLRIVQRSEE